MMQVRKQSFTLIEMLIVIVIIGILAAALVPRLISVQGRARDTKRKIDLSTIQKAVEIYKLDSSDYPLPSNAVSGACAYNVSCGRASYNSSDWFTTLTGILTSIPLDPINTVGDPRLTGNYSYNYRNVYNAPYDYYDLFAQLESKTDPDRCGVKNYSYYKWDGGTGLLLCGLFSSQAYVISAY